MNNKAVSAILGVILMVAITVAIAATVYVYVTDLTARYPLEKESPIKMEIYSKEIVNDQLNLKINFMSDTEASEDQYGIIVEYQEEKPSDDHMSKGFSRVSENSYDAFTCGEIYPGNNVKVYQGEWAFPDNDAGIVKEYKVVIYLGCNNGHFAGKVSPWNTQFVYYPERAMQTETFSIFV